jgi:hypothetical protein
MNMPASAPSEHGKFAQPQTIVVKKFLKGALRDNLTPYERARFLIAIDELTRAASKLLRRASLAFLFYVTKVLENGGDIPDVDLDWNDTEWNNWLYMDLTDGGAFVPTVLVPYVKELREHLGEASWAIRRPVDSTNVITHAATTFKTSVVNLLKVPFTKKLERLCKARCKAHAGGKGYQLFTAIRSNKIDDAWHEDLKTFVADARAAMGLDANEILCNLCVIVDNVVVRSLSIPVLYKVAWWMQLQFAALGLRKNMMAPVFNVSRAHVILDTTTLHLITERVFRPEKPPPTPKLKDLATSFPGLAKQELKRMREYFEGTRVEFEEKLAAHKIDHPSYRSMGLGEPECTTEDFDRQHADQRKRPDGISDAEWKVRCAAYNKDRRAATTPRKIPSGEQLLKDAHPSPIKPEGMTGDQWKQAKKTDQYKQALGIIKAKRESFKSTPAFIDAQQGYGVYTSACADMASSLFKPFVDRSSKMGWKATGTISTDGIALSVIYEKPGCGDRVVGDKPAKKKRRVVVGNTASSSSTSPPPCDDYNTRAELSTTSSHSYLVLGVDPGRVQLVTVVWVNSKGQKFKKQLSRSNYYTDAGIFAAAPKNRARYAKMEPYFAELQNSDAALKSENSEKIVEYLRWNARAEPTWWSVAFERAASVSKVNLYFGKRRTMDRFWSSVKTEAEKSLLDGQKLNVAYGEAGLTMSPTGPGEMAVPTSGMYKSCTRTFGKDVSPEDEWGTTKVSFDTQKVKLKVYKHFKLDEDGQLKEYLMATSGDYTPLVEDCDLPAFKAARRVVSAKALYRKRGDPFSERQRLKTERREDPSWKPRHMECRGLRFCTETRMFYDRDEASARAIAGLRCIKLLGLGRPTVFSRGKKVPDIVQS